MGELVYQFSTCKPEDWLAKHCFLFDASGWIRRITHSPYSHVDLVVDEGLLGASDSPGAPIVKGNARGVAIRPHNYQDFGVRYRAHVSCSNEVAYNVSQLMMNELGKPFDHTAVSAKHFLADPKPDRDWRDDGAWFCAELTTDTADRGLLWGGRRLIIRKDVVTPADFAHLLWPLMDVAHFMVPYTGG